MEKLINSDNENEKRNLIFNKNKLQKYASNYDKYVNDEISQIKETITILTNVIDNYSSKVDSLIEFFENIYSNTAQLQNYYQVIFQSYNIFLYMQAFSKKQLTLLYDLGICNYVQVYKGSAFNEASIFFQKYFNFYNTLNQMDACQIRTCILDTYCIENVIRILRDYKRLSNYKFEKVIISQGYVYNTPSIGKILAVSLTQEANKIFIWDLTKNQKEPFAILGGLFEEVDKIKIYRMNEEVLIFALGIRQIYMWNVTQQVSTPYKIFRLDFDEIHNYSVCNNNGKYFILGISYNNIYLWDLDGDNYEMYSMKYNYENAIVNNGYTNEKINFDIFHSYSAILDENYTIDELVIDNKSQIKTTPFICIKDYINNKKYKNLGYYKIDYFAISDDSKVMAISINDEMYIINVENKKVMLSIPESGQRILGIRIISKNNKYYLLAYCIYQKSRDNESKLIRCWEVSESQIVNYQEWFDEKNDIKKAEIYRENNNVFVLFNQYKDNIIYKVNINESNVVKFLEIPDSFYIVDMSVEL